MRPVVGRFYLRFLVVSILNVDGKVEVETAGGEHLDREKAEEDKIVGHLGNLG